MPIDELTPTVVLQVHSFLPYNMDQLNRFSTGVGCGKACDGVKFYRAGTVLVVIRLEIVHPISVSRRVDKKLYEAKFCVLDL